MTILSTRYLHFLKKNLGINHFIRSKNSVFSFKSNKNSYKKSIIAMPMSYLTVKNSMCKYGFAMLQKSWRKWKRWRKTKWIGSLTHDLACLLLLFCSTCLRLIAKSLYHCLEQKTWFFCVKRWISSRFCYALISGISRGRFHQHLHRPPKKFENF